VSILDPLRFSMFDHQTQGSSSGRDHVISGISLDSSSGAFGAVDLEEGGCPLVLALHSLGLNAQNRACGKGFLEVEPKFVEVWLP
jgi:hypothetical protein